MSIIAAQAVVVGIDEAGRGPLAGPVVAGACILPCSTEPDGEGRWRIGEERIRIGDSKLLSPQERDRAYAWITRTCIWGCGVTEASVIDSHGILEATERAMHTALAGIEAKITPTYLLIDGRDHFWFSYPKSSVIGGDRLEPVIAAASIIAKVTRDRMMQEYDQEFPTYGFAKHKGYAAPEHISALHTHGPCAIHRKTFLRRILDLES